MSKSLKPFLLATCLLPFTLLSANDADNALPQIIATSEMGEAALQEVSAEAPAAVIPEMTVVADTAAPAAHAESFASFTGKVRAKKLRLRVNAELDGYVIKELTKGELLSVIGEKGEYWAVEPIADTKAYIFRSFVLDNTVEGNHVNLRLEPSLDAPVIGHMNTGDTS